MKDDKVIITGFGPFADVVENASGRIAKGLDGQRVGESVIVGLELPTSFERARAEVSRLVEMYRPRVFVALGVAREAAIRLERRAGAMVTSELPDVDGNSWTGRMLGDGERVSRWPLEVWVDRLGTHCGPWPVRVSEDCGGYVCNATYHAVLTAIPLAGLFIHLPREALEAPDDIAGLVRKVVGLGLEAGVGS